MTDDCKYNKMVECATVSRVCSRCGWNPAIKEERTRKLSAQMSQDAGKHKED